MTTQGIQELTVPATGSYTITYVGASGGNCLTYSGGYGTKYIGTIPFNQGNIIKILICQMGLRLNRTGTSVNTSEGGGGTF
jgi:hypothetical protein